MTKPFTSARLAALAVLNSGTNLSRKGGSFLGQCVADDGRLSPAQADWLRKRLTRADLPPLEEEVAR